MIYQMREKQNECETDNVLSILCNQDSKFTFKSAIRSKFMHKLSKTCFHFVGVYVFHKQLKWSKQQRTPLFLNVQQCVCKGTSFQMIDNEVETRFWYDVNQRRQHLQGRFAIPKYRLKAAVSGRLLTKRCKNHVVFDEVFGKLKTRCRLVLEVFQLIFSRLSIVQLVVIASTQVDGCRTVGMLLQVNLQNFLQFFWRIKLMQLYSERMAH